MDKKLRRVSVGTNIIPSVYERSYDEIYRYYQYYQCGASLAVTGKRFGINRKVLERQFKKHGFKLRTRVFNPYKEYNGIRYYKMKDGYYRGGKDRHFIHYAIYGKTIPADSVLYFKDGDKENLSPENIAMMKKKDMGVFSNGSNQFIKKPRGVIK
jgi:hypothetical protein